MKVRVLNLDFVRQVWLLRLLESVRVRQVSKATIRDGDDDDPERVIGEEGKRKRESRVTFVEGYVSDIHVFLTTNSYSECFTSIC